MSIAQGLIAIGVALAIGLSTIVSARVLQPRRHLRVWHVSRI